MAMHRPTSPCPRHAPQRAPAFCGTHARSLAPVQWCAASTRPLAVHDRRTGHHTRRDADLRFRKESRRQAGYNVERSVMLVYQRIALPCRINAGKSADTPTPARHHRPRYRGKLPQAIRGNADDRRDNARLTHREPPGQARAPRARQARC